MATVRSAALAIAIVGAGTIVLAALSGFFYERAERAKDLRESPPVGTLVDIGGRSLLINCAGTGAPAVILESGSSWPLYKNPRMIFEEGSPRPGYSWIAIQRALSIVTTVCWYDRAGAGWSDPGPYPRDAESYARDLNRLLHAAGVKPPLILAAESSATLDALVYCGRYPADVAGVVLINGVDPDLFTFTRVGLVGRLGAVKVAGHGQDFMAQIFNQIGFYRAGMKPTPAPNPAPLGMSGSEWATVWRLQHLPRARSALMQDIGAWYQTTAEARAVKKLGDRPLIVVSSELNAMAPVFRETWMERQASLAKLSTRGKQTMAGGHSGEPIFDSPDVVAGAIRQVVDMTRRR